nr:unnamed protein product [Callosobruchus analis]
MELKEETALLKYENECLLQKIDAFDQMSRCNNLRIFQVKENPLENHKLPDYVTGIIKTHTGVSIDHSEILSCTRIGKMVNNKPRGILLKLTSNHKRQEIFNNKKKFKGSGIVIKEDLTDHRLKLMQAAVEKTSLRSVWSYNGHVFVNKDGKKVSIKNKKDLDSL